MTFHNFTFQGRTNVSILTLTFDPTAGNCLKPRDSRVFRRTFRIKYVAIFSY